MEKVYSAKDEAFIRKNYLKYGDSEMGERFGTSKSSIASVRRRLGLAIPKHVTLKRQQAALFGKTSATKAEDRYLRKHYLDTPVKTIATQINRSHTFVQTRLRQLGLKIPKKIIKYRKENFRFKKGQIPPNKGKNWSEYMSKKGMKNSRKTQFKKGNQPHNTNPFGDGAIVIRKDKSGHTYQYIRTSLGVWELLSRVVYAKEHGPIPKGHVIVFKDGNTMDCSPKNLEMISCEQNMERNTIHRYPAELKQIIRLNNKLKRIINDKTVRKENSKSA